MRIGIDLDGVVFDSETTFRTYEEIFDITILKNNNLVDRKEPKYQQRYNWTKEQEKEFIDRYYMQVSKESGLMSGFKAVYPLLKENTKLELIVITARGMTLPEMKDDAQRVLDENDIKFDKYFWGVKDKVDICKKEKIDLMIDDDWRIIDTMAKNNIKSLYFRDTNLRKLKNSKFITEVNNWGDIYRYIISKQS